MKRKLIYIFFLTVLVVLVGFTYYIAKNKSASGANSKYSNTLSSDIIDFNSNAKINSKINNLNELEGTLSNAQKDYYLTIDQMLMINDRANFTDKMTGLSILGKLGKSDIGLIRKVVSGGITMDEIKEIKEMLEVKLSEDDIAQIERIIQRNID